MIFQFVSEIKRNVDQVLWTEREFNNVNGIGQAQPMLLSPECREYFIPRLKDNSSYWGHNLLEKITTYSKAFFHDLSSQALFFESELFCIEASTKETNACLWNIFGTGWVYGVRRARVTKARGTANLSVNERINVIDFFSVPDTQPILMNYDEAP